MRDTKFMGFLFIFLYLVFTEYSACAQVNYEMDNFNVLIREADGDLNSDGIIDQVKVEMDTVSEVRPLVLRIYLRDSSGECTLFLSYTKIIEPMYPTNKDGEASDFQIPNFYIENGVLIMVSDIRNGQSSYEFKYCDKNFELIKVTKAFWDGINTTTEMEYNLVTGVKLEIDKFLGSEEIIRLNREGNSVDRLPKLKDFTYSDKKLY